MLITRRKDTTIVEVNPAFLNLTDYSRSQLLDKTTADLQIWVNSKDRESYVKVVREQGKVDKYESLFYNKNKKVYHCQISTMEIDYQGEECYITTVVDISVQKDAELRSKINKKKYERLVENSPDIIHIYSNKSGGIFWSSRIKELLGFDPDDVNKTPNLWHDSIHPEDIPEIEKTYSNPEELKKKIFIYRIKDVWGKWHWFKDKIINTKETMDEIIIEAIASDITREKKAEEALKKLNSELETLVKERTEELSNANKKLRWEISQHIKAEVFLREANEFINTLIESANVMVVGLDIKGEICIFNKAAEKITGYKQKEVEGANWFEKIVPKTKYGYVWKKFEKYTKGGRLPKVFENPILTKSGKEKYISWHNVEIKSQDKRFVSFSFGVDLTERKKTEEALHKTEEKLRLAVSNFPGFIWMVDKKERFTLMQGKLLEKVDLEPDEFKGKTLEEFFNSGNKNSLPILKHREALKGKVSTHHDSFKGIEIDVNLQPVISKKGEVTQVFGFAYDVTEKLAAEKALRKSEVKYRNLIKNMLTGYALHKIVLDKNKKPVDYIFLEINDAFERLTGLKRKNIIGKRVTEVLPGIENAEFNWIGIYGKVALTRKEKKFEQYSEQLKKWYSVTVQSQRKHQFVTIFEDITYRKKTEEALRESEERYRKLVEKISELFYVLDKEGNIKFVNSAATEIIGVKPEEMIGKPYGDFIYAEDYEQVKKDFEQLVSGKKLSHEFRLKHFPAGYRYVQAISTPDYKNGEIIGVQGLILDIT
jgi:PAS domain S-box-containing protein